MYRLTLSEVNNCVSVILNPHQNYSKNIFQNKEMKFVRVFFPTKVIKVKFYWKILVYILIKIKWIKIYSPPLSPRGYIIQYLFTFTLTICSKCDLIAIMHECDITFIVNCRAECRTQGISGNNQHANKFEGDKL